MGPTLVLAATALGLAVLVVHQRRRLFALTARLAETSRVDQVTGLLNRRAFEEMLHFEVERSRRTGRPLAVIVGEVDGLGRVNAERGHAAGDAALRQVGQHLSKWKRRIDSAGRIGGERFAVLLPETDEHGALIVAERLRRATRRGFSHDSVPLTISFGIASYPDHGEELSVLLGAAARAVEAATELGHERSVVYSADIASMLQELPDPDNIEPRLSSLIGLAEELDVRDTGTTGHCHTVARYAELMARELGFDPAHVERVLVAGLLHDIGKTGVSDRMLGEPRPLQPDDWHSVRTHPEIGARLLTHPDFEDLRDWVLAHHERPDGKGYPFGLTAHEIPIEARILAIADAFEAMTSERAFRSALGEELAIEELKAGAGTRFDETLVDVFVAALTGTHALPQAS